MGNNPSTDGNAGGASGARPVPSLSLGRRTGALGLSKVELDKRCKPSGLYPSCQWDDRAIRRLVGDGRLAARQSGDDKRASSQDRECPICFMQYSEVNVTSCCQANICTECYLQVRPQKEKFCACPFCNNPKLVVTVAKSMNAEAIQEREEDEQRVIEAKIRSRASTSETHGTNEETAGSHTPPSPSFPRGSFGSSLEQHDSVRRLRARSESMSSEDVAMGIPEDDLLRQISLTSEDRHALESEMKAQLSHPLSQRIEAEAEERRIQNEREYYRSNSGRVRREARAAEFLRYRMGSGGRRGRFARMNSDSLVGRDGSSRRDWNQIVDAFERGGNGEVQTLDDLVVLEAALILSMEQEARSRGGSGHESESGNNDGDFDAARHARDGFPLIQELMSRRSAGSSNRESGSEEGDTPEAMEGLTRGFLSSSARRLGGRRSNLLRGSGRSSAAHLDTAGMLLRGISEEEQMAMAIAMSLRETEAPQQQTADGDAENEEATETQTSDTSAAVSGSQTLVPAAIGSEETSQGDSQNAAPVADASPSEAAGTQTCLTEISGEGHDAEASDRDNAVAAVTDEADSPSETTAA